MLDFFLEFPCSRPLNQPDEQGGMCWDFWGSLINNTIVPRPGSEQIDRGLTLSASTCQTSPLSLRVDVAHICKEVGFLLLNPKMSLTYPPREPPGPGQALSIGTKLGTVSQEDQQACSWRSSHPRERGRGEATEANPFALIDSGILEPLHNGDGIPRSNSKELFVLLTSCWNHRLF